MAPRNCIKCGCSELLFNPETGKCVRQGCCCSGCLFELPVVSVPAENMREPVDVADLGRGQSTLPSTGSTGGKRATAAKPTTGKKVN